MAAPRKTMGAFDPSRRRFMGATALAALGASIGCAATESKGAMLAAAPDAQPGPYNFLFILSDQERYFEKWPFPAPGRERLRKLGVSFDNHQIAANVCSPSRSVIYTGQHLQHTGVFDNVCLPWQPSMSQDIPTLGDMMREAGYYTAYKGKFHLSRELEEANELESPERLLPHVLEEYGFADYFGIGDIIGNARGGYQHDEIIASMAVHWLRSKGRSMADRKEPWFLAVNLINPHDVMYVNTDLPGEPVQTADDPVMRMAPPPRTEFYGASWNTPLPATRHQAWDAPGRPQAHKEFQDSRAHLLGNWPDEDRRWRLLQDYYFNCIRDCDRHIVRMLDELEAQGLLDRTIIVFTSDHGEMGGAHQMHGKGSCVYREQNHVPLIIAHPEVRGGQRCNALTSHVDLAPTLVNLTQANDTTKKKLTQKLVGNDLSRLLASPSTAEIHAARDATLFNFNMLGYLDASFVASLKVLRDAKQAGKEVPMDEAIKKAKPALQKRGAIRSLYDGRYRFSRYFSPLDHHLPDNMEALLARNDIEVYDLQSDPSETANLALDQQKHGDLIDDLNKRLNQLITKEVGEDNGSMLPLAKLAEWNLEGVDV